MMSSHFASGLADERTVGDIANEFAMFMALKVMGCQVEMGFENVATFRTGEECSMDYASMGGLLICFTGWQSAIRKPCIFLSNTHLPFIKRGLATTDKTDESLQFVLPLQMSEQAPVVGP